jgi:hypothetical protein
VDGEIDSVEGKVCKLCIGILDYFLCERNDKLPLDVRESSRHNSNGHRLLVFALNSGKLFLFLGCASSEALSPGEIIGEGFMGVWHSRCMHALVRGVCSGSSPFGVSAGWFVQG